jgi:hypothetical protein
METDSETEAETEASGPVPAEISAAAEGLSTRLAVGSGIQIAAAAIAEEAVGTNEQGKNTEKREAAL